MDKENLTEMDCMFFDKDGITVNDDASKLETFSGKGRKKGSKNQKKSLEEIAKEYLANPTDENFQNLWKRSYYGLRQHAYKIVEDNDIVDEVTSNVYEKILTKSSQYDAERGNFSTWMYKICYNECLAYYNRKNKENVLDSDISDIYQSELYGSSIDAVDDYDYSDKFDKNENGDMYLMDREDVMKKFYDTSINVIKGFKDEGVMNCMLERFNIKPGDKSCPTLKDISKKYNYSITNVKNWVYKGKNLLKEEMMKNHRELYEMWKEVI